MTRAPYSTSGGRGLPSSSRTARAMPSASRPSSCSCASGSDRPVVCGSWVLFRAQSLTDSGHLVSGLFDFVTPFYRVDPMVLLLIGIGFGSHLLGSAKGLARSWAETSWLTRGLWYALLTLLIFLQSSRSESFIYFQF